VRTAKTVWMAILMVFAMGTFASAQGWPEGWREQEHPHYKKALADLRDARGILMSIHVEGRGRDQLQAILNDVNATMDEIRQAAIDDGRSPDDYAQPDPSWDRHGRLQHASELLDRAHDDIAFARENNPYARTLKNRADGHLNEARHRIQALLRWQDREWGERERREDYEHRSY
jgi:hypothetical protein